MRTFRKSTPEEIEEMEQLYKRGLSLSEIGRRLKKDHSTIWFHIKGLAKPKIKDPSHYFNRGKKQKRIIEPMPEELLKREIPDYIKKNLELEEKERKNAIIEKEKRKEKGRCKVCGKKIRSLKFRNTRFCGLPCFMNYNL